MTTQSNEKLADVESAIKQFNNMQKGSSCFAGHMNGRAIKTIRDLLERAKSDLSAPVGDMPERLWCGEYRAKTDDNTIEIHYGAEFCPQSGCNTEYIRADLALSTPQQIDCAERLADLREKIVTVAAAYEVMHMGWNSGERGSLPRDLLEGAMDSLFYLTGEECDATWYENNIMVAAREWAGRLGWYKQKDEATRAKPDAEVE